MTDELSNGKNQHVVFRGHNYAADRFQEKLPQDRFARGAATPDGRPLEAVVRQPLDGFHGRRITAGVALGEDFEAAQLQKGMPLGTDQWNLSRGEVQLPGEAAEDPRTNPQR